MRGIVQSAAIAVAALALTMVGAVPATAATTADLEFSVNGSPWSAVAPALFDSSWRPVPGSETSSTLSIRSNRPGTTIVAVYGGSFFAGSPEVRDSATLTSGYASMDFSGVETCTLLSPQIVLWPGDVVSVPLTLSLSPELESGQNVAMNLDLQLAASDTGPSTLANGCPIDPAIIQAFPVVTAPAADLPTTGSDFPGWLTLGAVAVTGGGVAALVTSLRRRRRERTGS